MRDGDKFLSSAHLSLQALRSTEEKEIRPEEAGEADMDIDSEDEDERKGPMRQPKSYARPPRRPVVIPEEVTEVIDLSDDEEPEKQEVNKAEENKPETEDSSLEKRQAGEPETEESPPEKKIKVIDTGDDEKKVAEVANVSPVKEHTEIRSGEEQTEEAKPEPLSQTEIVTGT